MKTVRITNITHGPGKDISIIDLYGQCILPGEFIFLPENAIDDKVIAHEKVGHIIIGEITKPNPPSQIEILRRLEEASLIKEYNTEINSEIKIESVKKKKGN